MNDTVTSRPTLDEKIESAKRLTLILSSIFFVSSLFQLAGVIEAGVPVWINVAGSIAVMVLALALPQKSLALTCLLAAIFIGLVADTLIATGYVLESWGAVATAMVVVRYLILLSAARAVGQVAVDLAAAHNTARRVAMVKTPSGPATPGTRIGLPASADAETPRAIVQERGRAAQELAERQSTIELGPNAAAIAFRILGGLLIVAGFGFGLTMTSFGEAFVGTIGFIVLPAMGIGAFFVASVEERYVPGLIAKLQAAIESGDTQAAAEARHKLVAAKHHSTRRLAAALVNDRLPIQSASGRAVLETIGEIGTLDEDAALALRQIATDPADLPEAARRVLGYPA